MIFFTIGNFFAGMLTLVGTYLFPTLIGLFNTLEILRNVLELPVIVAFDPLLVIVAIGHSPIGWSQSDDTSTSFALTR